MSYTDHELEKLLREGEADLVARQPSPANTGDIRKDICAFGNDPNCPASTDEKRWVDGVLARKKGLGF